MSLRRVVYGLLTAHAPLVVLVGSRIFDSGALGTPTGKQIPAKPFVVTNYGEDQGAPRRDGTVEDRIVDVYAYGEPGDYTVVEQVLREVKLALQDKAGVYVNPENSSDKTWLNVARYTGSSRDLFDDVYRANCRYNSFRLVGNTP
jgi:hypothetical protein